MEGTGINIGGMEAIYINGYNYNNHDYKINIYHKSLNNEKNVIIIKDSIWFIKWY